MWDNLSFCAIIHTIKILLSKHANNLQSLLAQIYEPGEIKREYCQVAKIISESFYQFDN